MAHLVDEQVLRNFIVNELSFEIEIFQSLLKIYRDYLVDIKSVKYDGSEAHLDKLGSLAHKIKSSCQLYGAEALRDVLVDLELASRARDKQKVGLLYDEVLKLLEPTLAEICRISDSIFNGEHQNG